MLSKGVVSLLCLLIQKQYFTPPPPQVLHFIATVVSKLKSVVATDVPSMFAAVFEPTLSMVTQVGSLGNGSNIMQSS